MFQQQIHDAIASAYLHESPDARRLRSEIGGVRTRFETLKNGIDRYGTVVYLENLADCRLRQKR